MGGKNSKFQMFPSEENLGNLIELQEKPFPLEKLVSVPHMANYNLFGFMGHKELFNLRQVSKSFKNLVDNFKSLERLNLEAHRVSIKTLMFKYDKFISALKDGSYPKVPYWNTKEGQTILTYVLTISPQSLTFTQIKYIVEKSPKILLDLLPNPMDFALITDYITQYHTIMSSLLNRGVSLNRCKDGDYTPLAILISGYCSINIGRINKKYLEDHKYIIQQLLEHGANPNQRTIAVASRNYKPFMLKEPILESQYPVVLTTYIQKYYSDFALDVLELLIQYGADLKLVESNPDSKNLGYTLIHYAVLNGCKNIVEFLLDNGLNPRQADAKGITAYQLAKEKGYTAIVELLDDYKPTNGLGYN